MYGILLLHRKLDEANPQRVVEKAKDSIIKRLGQVKGKDLMIFLYAHLAISLSSPEVALNILKGLESALKEMGFNVKRAPFGWHKEFELEAKGHPLAEFYSEISPYDVSEDLLCPCCGAQNPELLKRKN
jgi:Archaea-specific editing domain of threonyl-tRNA synthetase